MGVNIIDTLLSITLVIFLSLQIFRITHIYAIPCHLHIMVLISFAHTVVYEKKTPRRRSGGRHVVSEGSRTIVSYPLGCETMQYT